MNYVLITLLGGIIDQVTFYDGPYVAVAYLAEYVNDMNPEKNDAAVYGPDGIVANAKIFMDEDGHLFMVPLSQIVMMSKSTLSLILATILKLGSALDSLRYSE